VDIREDEDCKLALYNGKDGSFLAFYDDAIKNISDSDAEDCGDFVIGFTKF